MVGFQKHLKIFATSTLFVSLPLTAARADVVEDALARLSELVTQQGIQMEWASVDIDGDDVLLVDTTIGQGDTMVPVGDILLSEITKVDNGYRIERLWLEEYAAEDDSSTFLMEGMELTGVILPDEANVDSYGGFLFYETASIELINVESDGKSLLDIEGMYTEVSEPEDGKPMEFEGSADTFTLDLSFLDPQQLAVATALGYEQLTGSFEMEGSWSPDNGAFHLARFDTSVDDAGTLGLTFGFGGYTTDFISALRDIQAKMVTASEEEQSAQGLAILGLMQQLSFLDAEIKFTDDSLVNKVLEFVATSQGMKPADIANQAKAVLPFALAQIGNPELTMQATQAVSTFLDNPRSLTVKAAPAAPVPFALLMAGAMSSPAELTKSLAVTVTAND